MKPIKINTANISQALKRIELALKLIKPNEYTVTIEKTNNKRSRNANAYAWQLIGKIANKMSVDPKEVYQLAIQNTGAYYVFTVADDRLEHFVKAWTSKGTGWLCEYSNWGGQIDVICWYGSSVYNNKEMSALIDKLRQDCQALDIEYLTLEEEQKLLREWEN